MNDEPRHIPSFTPEGIIGQPLRPGTVPKTVLVVRAQAFGDAVITLPLLAGLRAALPGSRIEMVTSEGHADLFEGAGLLDAIWPLPARMGRISMLAAVPPLAKNIRTPDLFLDLQRSRQSRLLRALLRPPAWVAFDRFAPAAALDRYMEAARWAGLPNFEPHFEPSLTSALRRRALELLGTERNGPLVCLNPAGCWPTKNWSADRYAELALRMVEGWGARIVLLGTGNVREGAERIARALNGNVIDLVDRTTPAEALAVVSALDLMVSDDSGLMHIAWTTGVPTVGIFGASRRAWSRPIGEHTDSLGSEDLACGACMRASCARGDLLCLERVTVDEIFRRCTALLGRSFEV